MRAQRAVPRSGVNAAGGGVEWAVLEQGQKELESTLAQFRLIHDVMPVMLAYIDRELRYRYHNRAFGKWLARDAAQINGKTMREVLGEAVFAEIKPRIIEAFQGNTVRYPRTQKTANGGVARLFIHLVPHCEPGGKVAGIFALLIDHAEARKPAPQAATAAMRAAAPAAVPASASAVTAALRVLPRTAGRLSTAGTTGATRVVPAEAAPPVPPKAPPHATPAPKPVNEAQALYDESIDAELTGWQNAADRIKSAMRNNEFHLYAQAIMDLQSDGRRFYEIYMRMAEEEENMMPPGAFLPLAEKYGLMRDLDRWVVTAVLKAVVARRQADPKWEQAAYCINLSRDTLGDPYFPDFVRTQLAAFKVPGEALRFELQEADVLANPGDAANLVQQLSQLDCWSVLCGFGRDKVAFDILKDVPVGFLKIDSTIVLKMLRDDSALAKLKSINRVAHTVGINTIAELVESEDMIAKLREIGIDYAQGMAIGVPMPLKDVA
jgi:PAS domain S-box-containing protein